MSQPEIYIEEACDEFVIRIVFENGDKKRYRFEQEDDKKKLVEVFKALGFHNVTYEEVY